MNVRTASMVVGLACAAVGCGTKIPVLAPTSSHDDKFRNSDDDTADLSEGFGLTEGILQAAMTAAKPDNCVDGMGSPIPCYEYSQYGCKWIAAFVDNPGTATVRASGTRDYMMICEAPDGTLFGSDDFDTNVCVNMGECDPGLVLDGVGIWTCLFTVSPYTTIFFPTNSPTGGEITVTVEP